MLIKTEYLHILCQSLPFKESKTEAKLKKYKMGVTASAPCVPMGANPVTHEWKFLAKMSTNAPICLSPQPMRIQQQYRNMLF